jgi:hypothetical protein
VSTVQQALDRIWSDEALKKSLLADPKPVLKGFGMEIADNVSVQVHENTPSLINVVLPAKPAESGSLNSSDPVSRLIEHAWQNPAFKARLLNNPKEAAAESGIHVPDKIQVKVWENTATVQHLVLPLNPSSSELSDADLEAVAGGSSKGGSSCPGTTITLPSSSTPVQIPGVSHGPASIGKV